MEAAAWSMTLGSELSPTEVLFQGDPDTEVTIQCETGSEGHLWERRLQDD